MMTEKPEPPYYAVIFSSRLSGDTDGYDDMAWQMEALAAHQPGFLGIESARGPDGFGLTISYWRSLDDIRRWRENAGHRVARTRGNERWYADYDIRIARVERAYGGPPRPDRRLAASVQDAYHRPAQRSTKPPDR